MSTRHEVDLFTLADQPEDLAYQQDLRQYCSQVTVARLHPGRARLRSLPYLFTQTPLTIPHFYSPELYREVRSAVGRRSYDRIFVYCSAMMQYVEQADQIPVLTDFVDIDSDKWTQYAGFTRFPLSTIYRREGRCLREYEREACRRSACVLVTTEREAELARKIAPGTAVHVVRNGVDSVYFNPPAIPQDGPPSIVFMGDLSYFPNQEAVVYFTREVFPLIRRSLTDARFLVVGRNPSRQVRGLAGIAGVEVTGYVPDVREHLARAQVFVAPFSIAAGIPNKILEAMAYGLPVVATPRAVQGLSSRVAAVIQTAESTEQLAAGVLALLQNPAAARRQGLEGRRRVIDEHNWEHALERLLELVDHPASTARTGAGAA